MLKRFLIVFLAAIFVTITPHLVMAFELVEDQGEPTTFGVGYECSINYLPGVTITYNATDNLALQGIIGLPYSDSIMDFYNVNLSYGGKLWYRLIRKPTKNLYIFGLLGSFSRNTLHNFGGAAGVGIEISYFNIPNFVYFGELGYSIFGLPDTSMILANYGLRIYF